MFPKFPVQTSSSGSGSVSDNPSRMTFPDQKTKGSVNLFSEPRPRIVDASEPCQGLEIAYFLAVWPFAMEAEKELRPSSSLGFVLTASLGFGLLLPLASLLDALESLGFILGRSVVRSIFPCAPAVRN